MALPKASGGTLVMHSRPYICIPVLTGISQYKIVQHQHGVLRILPRPALEGMGTATYCVCGILCHVKPLFSSLPESPIVPMAWIRDPTRRRRYIQQHTKATNHSHYVRDGPCPWNYLRLMMDQQMARWTTYIHTRAKDDFEIHNVHNTCLASVCHAAIIILRSNRMRSISSARLARTPRTARPPFLCLQVNVQGGCVPILLVFVRQGCMPANKVSPADSDKTPVRIRTYRGGRVI